MTTLETVEPSLKDGFSRYVAVGDSISIDLYPGLDVQEREGLPRPPSGLGAASLLHRNDDDRWPEFRGRDLTSAAPGTAVHDLTADGATTESVLHGQLPRVPAGDDLEGRALVTLTVGGNDLVGLLDLGFERPPARLVGGNAAVRAIAETAERIVAELRRRLPAARILVGTVYDPSDGTADLGDGVVRTDALQALSHLNDSLRRIAAAHEATPVNIHGHFLGHGLTEPNPGARWYWRHSIIEPSARGASEVRRLWVEALGL